MYVYRCIYMHIGVYLAKAIALLRALYGAFITFRKFSSTIRTGRLLHFEEGGGGNWGPPWNLCTPPQYGAEEFKGCSQLVYIIPRALSLSNSWKQKLNNAFIAVRETSLGIILFAFCLQALWYVCKLRYFAWYVRM